MDDCPEDDRETIVKSYKDKRIKYFKNNTNLGIALSRNKLIDMAEGEYLAVFDHDDVSLPSRLEKQVNYLDQNPDVGVVSSWFNIFPKNKISRSPVESHEIKVGLMGSCIVSHSASMIRKSILIENDIKYNGDFTPAEDYELWGRLINVTNFYNIPEILLNYRVYSTNTSKKIKREWGLWT